jgi:antitoxin (DNA-binding transcriptional repressor) of toxin-antitoxin stability system
MMKSMAQVHMTEAEVARDLHEVLAKVQRGVEVVVEQDHRPVAVIRSPLPEGRLLSECIALAESRGSTATLDEGFMKDVEEGIASRSQRWSPPTWE